MNQSSNAFIKWRYIYEKEDKDRRLYFVFLKKFMDVLKRVAHGKYCYGEAYINITVKEMTDEFIF